MSHLRRHFRDSVEIKTLQSLMERQDEKGETDCRPDYLSGEALPPRVPLSLLTIQGKSVEITSRPITASKTL